MWYSEDGIQWTSATLQAAFPVRSGHSSVIFDNKMWIIGGADNSVAKNDVWWSEDGNHLASGY